MEAKHTEIKLNPKKPKPRPRKSNSRSRSAEYIVCCRKSICSKGSAHTSAIVSFMLDKKKQGQRQMITPEKASSVVQTMQDETILPGSLQEPFDDILQNMTPQSKSSAATSQDILSRKSNIDDTISQDLLSQKCNTFTSRYLLMPRSNDPKETRTPPPPPPF